jgi:Domain of unknown function (DUF4439)
MASTGDVAALQAALAAENAAIFGYGVAGAHLTGSSQAAAEQDWTSHNQARDALAAMIAARGAVPAAAQPYYQLPFRVHDAPSAIRLAAYLEDGVTRAYLGLVAVSDQRLRRFGALAMQDAAQRAASWRGSTLAFPGLTPLALSSMIMNSLRCYVPETVHDHERGRVTGQVASSMIAAAISSSRRSAP